MEDVWLADTRSAGRRAATGALAAGALVWVLALAAAPALARSTAAAPAGLAAATYAVGSLVCHQAPARSFRLAGVRLPVCARCTGLYAGAAAGALWVWRRRARWTDRPHPALLVAGAPTLASWLAEVGGLGDPGNTVRAVLALPLGAVTGGLVSAVLAGEVK